MIAILSPVATINGLLTWIVRGFGIGTLAAAPPALRFFVLSLSSFMGDMPFFYSHLSSYLVVIDLPLHFANVSWPPS